MARKKDELQNVLLFLDCMNLFSIGAVTDIGIVANFFDGVFQEKQQT